MVVLLLLLPTASLAMEPPGREPETRALMFLAREVPRWSRENHCFSCHNNGDGARALYAGLRAGYPIPQAAVADTNNWLSHIERWEHNGGDGPFSDKRLARLQFTTALAAAKDAGQVDGIGNLLRAADRLAKDQAADGCWSIEGDVTPGSPTTYGSYLATYLAHESLKAADAARYREAIRRARDWLAGHQTGSIMDASVKLLMLGNDTAAYGRENRAKCLDQLRRGQSDDGGWGPFAGSPPENFDTALALIALASAGAKDEVPESLRRGRGFLIARQQHDGSWIETTRPPGAESYAQRISTTGWAALALIATREGSAGQRLDQKR